MSNAAVIVIGNEILSGRTRDENLAWLAVELNKIGVQLREARVIPDIEEVIIKSLNELRSQYDFVFTSGGIGPTHDDITSETVAKAFGVAYICNSQAREILSNHYGEENLNESRLKMAYMPEGASLIENPVSAAPGFLIGNVIVMAGVPRIMQAMFANVKHKIKGGKPILSETVSIFLTEGIIAKGLSEIQNNFPDVEIGSYPFIKNGRLGTSLVSRHTEQDRINEVVSKIKNFVESLDGEIDD